MDVSFRAPPSLILALEQLVSQSLVAPSSMTSPILMGLWRSPMKDQALTRVLVTVLQLLDLGVVVWDLPLEGTMKRLSEKNLYSKNFKKNNL